MYLHSIMGRISNIKKKLSNLYTWRGSLKIYLPLTSNLSPMHPSQIELIVNFIKATD